MSGWEWRNRSYEKDNFNRQLLFKQLNLSPSCTLNQIERKKQSNLFGFESLCCISMCYF